MAFLFACPLTAPDSPNFLGMYSMAPMTDYEEQIRGINYIRNTVINATRRIICYNQPIYDDMRLEMTEYAGLTLAVRDPSVFTVVRPMYDQVAITILDNDGEVHFTHNLENGDRYNGCFFCVVKVIALKCRKKIS